MPNKPAWNPAPPREPVRPPLWEYPGGRPVAGLLISYVVIVLLVDTLATQNVHWPINWEVFDWKPRDLAPFFAVWLPQNESTRAFLAMLTSPKSSMLDLFKLTFWFIIPFLFTLRWMDWGAWRTRRWKWWDWPLLAFGCLAGLGAMFLIPYLPGVSEYYQPPKAMTLEQKTIALVAVNVWCFSWLLGWEFLHRYVLVGALARFFPRGQGWGWLLVPLLVAASETAYHLVKAPIEAAAMFGFGFVATAWAYQRSNILLPLLVHWAIEISLVVYLVASAGTAGN